MYIEKSIPKTPHLLVNREDKMGKIAFLFSGQGAQYVGMGKDLCEKYQEAKSVFELSNQACGFDITGLCFHGPQEDLNLTENTQPAILTTSVAVMEVLKKEGIIPDVVAGLSLGEYSALVCSGALSLEEAVPLVKKRGKYMQEAVPEGVGGMAAIVGLDRETVFSVCEEAKEDGVVEAANFNCPGQIVLAGEHSALDKAIEIATGKGAKMAMKLPVSAPFHSSMLQPASDKLKEELEEIQIRPLLIPLISNVDADYVSCHEEVKPKLIHQVVSPVKWEDSIRRMIDDGVDTFIEVGPGKALTGFIKKIDRKLNYMNVEDMDSLEQVLTKMGRKS